jgi:hypothetical protein
VRSFALLAMLGCGGGAPATTSSAPRPQGVLDEIAWLEGDWKYEGSHVVTVRVGDATWAIWLTEELGFAVEWTEATPTGFVVVGVVNGSQLLRNRATRESATRYVTMDKTTRSALVRDGDGGFVEIQPAGGAASRHRYTRAVAFPAAPAVEAMDRAAATASDRYWAWTHMFDTNGSIWDGHEIRGSELRNYAHALFADGVLDWTPIASGRRGKFAFTRGTYRLAHARGAIESGTYVTIWKHDDHEGWQAMFRIDSRAAHAEAQKPFDE